MATRTATIKFYDAALKRIDLELHSPRVSAIALEVAKGNTYHNQSESLN